MGLEIGVLVLNVLIKVSDFPLPNLVTSLKPKWVPKKAVQVPMGIVTSIKNKQIRENPKGLFRYTCLKADFLLKDLNKLKLSCSLSSIAKENNFYYLKIPNTFGRGCLHCSYLVPLDFVYYFTFILFIFLNEQYFHMLQKLK